MAVGLLEFFFTPGQNGGPSAPCALTPLHPPMQVHVTYSSSVLFVMCDSKLMTKTIPGTSFSEGL